MCADFRPNRVSLQSPNFCLGRSNLFNTAATDSVHSHLCQCLRFSRTSFKNRSSSDVRSACERFASRQ